MGKNIPMDKIKMAINNAHFEYKKHNNGSFTLPQYEVMFGHWTRPSKSYNDFLSEEINKLVNTEEVCEWEKELYENPTWNLFDPFNGSQTHGGILMVRDDMKLFVQEQFYKIVKDISRLSRGLDLRSTLDLALVSRGLKSLTEMEDSNG